MKAASAKNKGRRLELLVAKELRRKGIDKEAKRMILSGGSYLKGDVWAPNINYLIECKNQEKVRLWEWWDQTVNECGFKTPMLVVSANYREPLVVMRLDDVLNLLQIEKESLNAATSSDNHKP